MNIYQRLYEFMRQSPIITGMLGGFVVLAAFLAFIISVSDFILTSVLLLLSLVAFAWILVDESKNRKYSQGRRLMKNEISNRNIAKSAQS
jgi:uncharacterized RDD family membrane protein YckC